MTTSVFDMQAYLDAMAYLMRTNDGQLQAMRAATRKPYTSNSPVLAQLQVVDDALTTFWKRVEHFDWINRRFNYNEYGDDGPWYDNISTKSDFHEATLQLTSSSDALTRTALAFGVAIPTPLRTASGNGRQLHPSTISALRQLAHASLDATDVPAERRNEDTASAAVPQPTNRSSNMSNEQTPAAASNKPWLRNKDDVALWPTKEGSKAALSGHVKLGGEKVQVVGFINTKDKDGEPLNQPYVSLSRQVGQGDDAKWETVANGNAMNHRSDGKPVYFDQVIFNVKGGDETFNAYVSRDCPADFHKELGFTSPPIERPAKEQAQDAAPEASEEDEQESSPRP